ncbi:MAG: chorismate mutase [Alphaproteobacteria bacterium]|nr:chorismate mutase [Alphaproteobacteria bacterium]
MESARRAAEAELADLRRAIDGVDGALVALLARRFGFVEKVVAAKHQLGLPAAIPTRVEEVVARVRAEAAAQGFPPGTAEKLWRQLIADMIAYEEKALATAG